MRLFSFALLGALALAGCDNTQPESCPTTDTFSTEDLTPEGTELGDTIATNDCVTVDYVGRLADGSGTFDEGTLRFVLTNQQSNVYLTAGSLITGFVLGTAAQQVGQTRRIVIPPSLGYRDRAIPDPDGEEGARVGIPACSTLEFDITVTAIDEDLRVCAR